MRSTKIPQILGLLVASVLWTAGDRAIAEDPYSFATEYSSGADSYEPLTPTIPPPSQSSGYAGDSFVSNNNDYQQSTSANGWSGASANAGSDGSMLTYNAIELGYRYIDPKGSSIDGSHGLGASVSFALMQPFFIKAGFNWTSGSGGDSLRSAKNADYSLTTVTVAGGAYMSLTDKLHFVGEVGFIYAKLDASRSRVNYEEVGIYVRPSLRYQALDNLEVQGGVTVGSNDDYDSKILDLSAYYRVLPQLDLNLGADFGDENRTLKAGVRVRW